MRTMMHSHLRGQNGCLGFYYGLDPLLTAYPEGGLPGEFFINGKTQSIWVWDATGHTWYDTNHAAPAPFMGIITTPETFSPTVEQGVSACYVYVAGSKGSYVFSALKEGATMTVNTETAAIITLVWDGSVWRNYVTPLSFEGMAPPYYLYRGLWSNKNIYKNADNVSDVVYFMDKYYRVKPSVGSTTAPPTETDYWEEFPRFCAIANAIELKSGAMVFLDDMQCIRVANDFSTWDLCDGEIRHIETGTFLSQAGELRIPVLNGEMVLSPIQKGLVIFNSNEIVFRLELDENNNIQMTMTEVQDDGKYEIVFSPRQACFSYFDSTGQEVRKFKLSADGLSGTLKKWTDILSSGDFYVDDNNFIKLKK